MPPRWQLTEFALRRGAHALRCSVDAAEDRLYELMPSATHRETDRQGRELWRSPRSQGGGLRWVLDTGWTVSGAAAAGAVPPPHVIWVGHGAPPEEHWDPAPAAPATEREREEPITLHLDPGARRILHELSAGGHTPSTVVARLLREEEGRRRAPRR